MFHFFDWRDGYDAMQEMATEKDYAVKCKECDIHSKVDLAAFYKAQEEIDVAALEYVSHILKLCPPSRNRVYVETNSSAFVSNDWGCSKYLLEEINVGICNLY